MPYAFVTLLILVGLAGPAMALFLAAPDPDAPMIVVAAPGHDLVALVAKSGGSVVGPESAAMAVFAASYDPDFVRRARENGAWLVVGGAALAAICGVAEDA